MMKSQTTSLKIHEWLAVVLLCASILVVCLTTRSSSAPLLIKKSQRDHLEILIRGAIVYPGIYQIDPETTLEEVLALCEVCPNADLRRFKLSSLVKKGRILNIPAKKPIHSKKASFD